MPDRDQEHSSLQSEEPTWYIGDGIIHRDIFKERVVPRGIIKIHDSDDAHDICSDGEKST